MHFLSFFLTSAVHAIVINSYDQFTKANFAQESEVTFGTFSVPGSRSLDVRFKNGATVKFTGKITFEKGSWGKKKYFFYFRGDGLKISGGLFDGNGQFYWDGKGMHSNKPHFFAIETTNSYYSDMKLINAPVFMIQVHNDGNTFDGLVLEAGGSKPLTKNTDGFGMKILTLDISANDITIKNTIVTNQDDCVAINRGTNIVLENLKCVNGHGISIGSIRRGAVVDGVKITDCQVYNSQQGFRIKGWFNDKGTVKNVLVNGLKMQGITKGGVVIVQDYAGGPQMGKFASGFDIQYSNIKLMNVVGSVMPKAKTQIIMCAKDRCNNMDLQGVKISGDGAPMPDNPSPPKKEKGTSNSEKPKNNRPSEKGTSKQERPKNNKPKDSKTKDSERPPSYGKGKGDGKKSSSGNSGQSDKDSSKNSSDISGRVDSVSCSSGKLVISFTLSLPSDSKLSRRRVKFTLDDKSLRLNKLTGEYGMSKVKLSSKKLKFTEVKDKDSAGGSIELDKSCENPPSPDEIKIYAA